jgi:hypothetical protein
MNQQPNSYRQNIVNKFAAQQQKPDATSELEWAKKQNAERLREKKSVLKQALGNIVEVLDEHEVDSWIATLEDARKKKKVNMHAAVSFSWRGAK